MNWQQYLEQGKTVAIGWAPSIIAALAIFIVGLIVTKILTSIIRRTLEKLKVDELLVRFLTKLARVILLLVVILAAVAKLGVQTTSFIAILGAAGLAIGLALQDSLSNFAAGIMVVLFRPYKVGDYVEAGGTAGVVVEVQIFTTVLNTPDNKRVIVPNGQIVQGTITNFSAHSTRRADFVFGVGYDDDLKKVRSVLEDVIKACSTVNDEPAPQIFVTELADSSVNFGVRVWCNTPDYWKTVWHLNETVKLRFDEEGISIPFPQRDVHLIRQDNAESG
ncbi:MAG: mechanosensitive ion channel [Gammaproteobacteria bacterium]|nr:mechanosensitive ion channel [Gammaproteobacteria bacterium]